LLPGDREAHKIKLGLNVEEEFMVNGKALNWEMNTFYHTPLVADITILSQLQNDVKNAEFYVVNELYKDFKKLGYNWDTMAARVIAPTSYVLLGDDYESDIFLAAFSTTDQPKIILGELNDATGELQSATDSVVVENGVGKFKIKTDQEGLQSYEGVIKIKNQLNEIKTFPFKSNYLVSRPTLTVSADRMNALYIGPDNPVSISVPGVPSENITVKISGGNRMVKTGNGKYTAVLRPESPSEVFVSVSAKLPSGEEKNMGRIKYRALKLPKPYATFAGKQGKLRMRATELSGHIGIRVKYGEDFVFNLPISAHAFKVEIVSRNQVLPERIVSGNRIPEDLKNTFRQLPKNSKVILSDIKATGKDGVEHNLGPIIIEIY